MNSLRIGLFSIAILGVWSAPAAAFKNGERAVFFGDSCTHGGQWVKPLQDFYYTRFPTADIRIMNCGVGGETAEEAARRVEADLLWRKPTYVAICFGMNDVCVVGYTTNAPPWAVDRRMNAPQTFARDMRALQRILAEKLPGARFCWCTLVPWDDELLFMPPRGPITGVTDGERPLCQTVADVHKEFGGDYVDFYEPMLAYNKKLHATDPYASLSPDTIHPKEPGGLFMMRLFIKAQGVDGTVSDVAIDVNAAQVVRAVHATVSGLKKTEAGGVVFSLLEAALPFPVDPKARVIADALSFDDAFNREILAIRGLADGKWALRIDGKEVVTASAADWARGVNLAKLDTTPMMAQARAAAALNAEKMNKERAIRDLWVARGVAYRRLQWHVRLNPEDYADDRYAESFIHGYLTAGGGEKGDGKMYAAFKKNWRSVPTQEAEVEKLHREVRGLCVPKEHIFEFVAGEGK